ncbi:MAG: hypothetical protein MJZ65_04145, partial [Paludibacteraceae bacterium]|nr:hypothetical protein [Paludibacteraceae bacterium]
VASRYNYVLSTLDANGTPLHVYIGDFATLGYQGELKGGGDEVIPTPPIVPVNPEAHISTNIGETKDGKCPNGIFLKNGQIFILHNGKLYNPLGSKMR